MRLLEPAGSASKRGHDGGDHSAWGCVAGWGNQGKNAGWPSSRHPGSDDSQANAKDLMEIPQHLREGMVFHELQIIMDALEIALVPPQAVGGK